MSESHVHMIGTLGEGLTCRASTETAFLEIVRKHNVQEEESRQRVKSGVLDRLRRVFRRSA